MTRRFLLSLLLTVSMTLSGIATCTGDSAMDPVWGPQCPPGYEDACNADGTNCSCKRK